MSDESHDQQTESVPSDGENSKKECESFPNQSQTHDETFNFSPHPTLEEIRQMISEFASDRDWNQYHTPRNLLLALVGEIGELSELFQWKGEMSIGLKEMTESEKKCVSHEISDCLIYLVRFADRCRIDLPNAVIDKMRINQLKYPIEKVYGSSKKYNQYDDS